MRYFILILLVLPLAVQAQQQKDYERVVDNFMRYYNNNMIDSIRSQYSDSWGGRKKMLWSEQMNDKLIKYYGQMQSYKFIEVYRDGKGDGGGDGIALFKTTFVNSTHMMGVSLDKKNKILTFRFQTRSPHIDSVFKKN